MNTNILICTVGGSHQPIVTAIREAAPAFVCFLCTDRDPVTGQLGSRVQVEGKGSIIKAHPKDEKPTLPNIPTQAGLKSEQYEVRVVPADDLDGVVSKSVAIITGLRRLYPDGQFLADYTGGTKTMTAGLVMAALEIEYVELRFVTGARGDLVKVHDGTQRSAAASAERVRLQRAMAPHLAAWERYGYAEAAKGLGRLKAPSDGSLSGELQIALDLSVGFDAWDRFDHKEALERLNIYRPRIGAKAGLLLTFLEILAAEDGCARKEPARLLDLWLNAQRRAAQGRYDDAVARAYRLLEWTAQWLLREQAEIDTTDIPENKVPEGLGIQPNREGKWQAGLFAAWGLVACYLQGAPKRFADTERNRMREQLLVRNSSILAHGYTPIVAETWQRLNIWMEGEFLPVLHEAASNQRVRITPTQLPTRPVWIR